MKLSAILLGGILVVSSGNIAVADKTVPTTATGRTINFKCQTRGSTTNVVLKSSLKYSATSSVVPPTNGNYMIAAGPAYRFKTGGLKGSSIIKQGRNFYLVDTAQEANAAQLAAADGALFCQEIADFALLSHDRPSKQFFG